MKELQDIDNLISLLKDVKKEYIKLESLSKKSLECNTTTHTHKQIQKISANHSWQCMEYDKSKTLFARYYAKSCIKTGTETKYYSPSGFHEYKF